MKYVVKSSTGEYLSRPPPSIGPVQWVHQQRFAWRFTEQGARWTACGIGASPVRLVPPREASLVDALRTIAAVEKFAWKCSYCGHYAQAHREKCAGCGREGGYCGSHDRDLTGCYRTMRELATNALQRAGHQVSDAQTAKGPQR